MNWMRRWLRAAHGLALAAGPRRLNRRRQLALSLKPTYFGISAELTASLWCDEAEEELLLGFPPPRMGYTGTGDNGEAIGQLAMAQLWWLGVHLNAWRALGRSALSAPIIARRRVCIRKLVRCRSYGMLLEHIHSTLVEPLAKVVEPIIVLAFDQPTIVKVCGNLPVGTGSGFTLSTGSILSSPFSPWRGGKRSRLSRKKVSSLSNNRLPGTIRGRSPRLYFRQHKPLVDELWVVRWNLREKMRTAAVDREASRHDHDDLDVSQDYLSCCFPVHTPSPNPSKRRQRLSLTYMLVSS